MADRQKPVSALPAPDYGQRQYAATQPLDRPDLRVAAQRSFGLADVAFRLSDIAQQQMTREAVQYAEVEGAKASESRDITVVTGPNATPQRITVPKFTKAEGTGAMAEAWNRAQLQTYGMRMDTLTMSELQRIELTNPGDPDAQAREIAAFSAGVKAELPPEYIQQFDHDLMRLSRPMILAATQARLQKTAEDQALAAKGFQEQVIGQIVTNASREGAAGIMGATVNAEVAQNLWNALTSRIDGITYSAQDAVTDYQQTIRAAVPGIIQAQYATAPDKRKWMQQFLEGKIGIVVPHLDTETGTITPGSYDNQALTSMIDPDHLGQIINGMQADIRAQDSERRAIAAEARQAARDQQIMAQAEIYAVYDDAVAEAEATGKSPLSATEIMTAYPGRAGEKMVRKLELAQQTGSVRKVIATNSPGEDAAYIESLKPVPGTPDFAEQTALYNIALAERDRKVKALDSDPASYVLETNSQVQAAWQAAQDGDPAKVKQAVALTKQAQTALGVPPEAVQAMPTRQASQLASGLQTATPDAVAGAVDAVTATYGEDGLNQVIGAGVPPMVKAVAFADQPDQAAWRVKAIQAMQIKESDLEAQAKARGVTTADLNTALETVLPGLLNTMPAASAAPYMDAVRQVALYNIAFNGMSANAAAADAFSAFDAAYTFQGTYRVPKRYDADAVSAGAAELIGRLELYDVAPAITGQGGAVDPAFAKDQTIMSLKAGNYRWVTDRGDGALILTYQEGNPVLVRDGKDEPYRPLRITFDELTVLGKGLPAPGSMGEQLRGLSGAN